MTSGCQSNFIQGGSHKSFSKKNKKSRSKSRSRSKSKNKKMKLSLYAKVLKSKRHRRTKRYGKK